MGILNELGKRLGVVAEAKNVDRAKPENASINAKVIPRQSIRAAQDIERWRQAIRRAENTIMPERRDLQIIFNEIHFDAHISALITHLKQYIQGVEWCIYNKATEEEDEAASKILNASWFQQFLSYCVEAKIYGYSLIEFGAVVNSEFSSISIVDRRYVMPEVDKVRKDLWSYDDTINFNEPPYNMWCLFVGDKYDLGLLNKAAPYWIYKKQALGSWAEYQQILGVPPRVGKTNIRDDQRRQNMEIMLRDMGHASYAVLDVDDIVEFIGTTGGASNENAFKAMIDYLNKELSKLFVGQTMTSEDGSSRSQSETHAGIFEMIMQGYKQFITDVVNSQLMPLLVYHRILPQGLIFEFEEKEVELSHIEKVKTIVDLAPYFNFTPEYINQYLGIEVEAKTQPTNTTPLNRLQNYYGLDDFNNPPKHVH